MKSVYVILLVCLLPIVANSALIQVPGDYTFIQDGINAAVDGDTVMIAPGTYIGTGNKNLDFLGKKITVRSSSALCVIDCEGQGRGVRFHGAEDNTSVLMGIQIMNGYTVTGTPGTDGGGILCENGSAPTIVRCRLEDNTAVSGGAIACDGSSPKIQDCFIVDNSSVSTTQDEGGGGISCRNSSNPEIINCQFYSNSTAHSGGGLFCFQNSSPDVIACMFHSNESYHGGGIDCRTNSSPTISKCIVRSNESQSNGGGIHTYDYAAPVITGSAIKYNHSLMTGGGLFAAIDSDPVLVDCSIVSNSIT